MNKGIVIGIIVVIIIAAIIGVASSLNLETVDNSSIDESSPMGEIIPEPENTGKNLSVELSENIGLSSP